MSRALALLCLAACAPFAPTEGLWQLSAVATESNTCVKSDGTSLIDPAEPGDTYTLTNTGKGTFTTELPLDQGETIVSLCALDDEQVYTCAPNATSLELVPDGVMTITQTDGGSFEGPDLKHGGSVIDLTCAGEGCPDVEELFDASFPCQAVLTGEASPL